MNGISQMTEPSKCTFLVQKELFERTFARAANAWTDAVVPRRVVDFSTSSASDRASTQSTRVYESAWRNRRAHPVTVARNASDHGSGRDPATSQDATRLGIRERLLRILITMLPTVDMPSLVDDSTGLLGHGIGLDSVEALALVGAIEEAFDITVDDEDLDAAHFETVGTLVGFVQAHLPA